MKKGKNIFKILGLSVASICMLSGGIAFFNGTNHLKGSDTAYAYPQITNSTPDFFATSNITDDYFSFVDPDVGNDDAKLFFGVEQEEKLDGLDEDEREKFRGAYDDGLNYSIFAVDNIQISINGNSLNSFNFSGMVSNYAEFKITQDTDIVGGKTYYEKVDDDYVVVRDPIIAQIENYYERVMPYSLPVFPEAFDARFALDLTQPSSTISGNTLTLNEQGLVSISISYTRYFTSIFEDEHNTKTLVVEDSLTNQTISYSFLLLDKSGYLETSDDNSPKLTYDKMTRANSTLPNFKYNYFYHYDSQDLPYINYNVTYFELSLLKSDLYENTYYNKIVYNPSSSSFEVYDENGDIVSNPLVGTKLNGKTMSIFFYDLGEYSLSFETIFINGNDIYSVSQEMKSQKVYVFGTQAFYTISSGNYAELKTYDDHHTEYSFSADKTEEIVNDYANDIQSVQFKKTQDTEIDNKKTYYTKDVDVYTAVANPQTEQLVNYYEDNFANVNEVSTNRLPLKFRTLESVKISSSEYYFRADGEKNWQNNANNFSISNNFMNAGDYIVKITYTFANDIDNTPFTQYFTFKITQNAPNVDVTKEDGTNVADGAFLNEDVLISFDEYKNNYNKTVSIYIEKYDFLTGSQIEPELIDWEHDGNNYEIVENGKIKVSADGNYTISLIREGRTNPIQRKFNIDTVTEFNLGAYNVELSQVSQRYYAGTPVEILTNQSIVFSWDTVKASGAKTYGSFKHYSLGTKGLYTSSFLTTYLSYFLERNIIPVEYQLDLTQASSWNSYTNFDYAKNSSQVVSSEFIKSEAGLYIIQTYDSAGNSQTKIYIIDSTSPLFLRQSLQSLEYSLLNNYNTVTDDSKILWSKYKAIFINKFSEIDFTNDNLDLYKNRKGTAPDNDIQIAFQKIIAGDNLAPSPNSANLISKLMLPYENSTYSGYYLAVEIEDDVYFKNYYEEDFNFLSGQTLDYEYEVVTSYKIYFDIDQHKFLRTTTEDEELYISVDGQYQEYYPNPINLREVSLLQYTPTTYIIHYDGMYLLYYVTYDTIGENVSVTYYDESFYYEGELLTKVEFVDKEAQYCFLIMDKANTKLSNRSKSERYLTYPSAFQYITITGDKSRLSVGFTSNGQTISLADSSVVKIEEIPEGLSKSIYYRPTNENVLTVSFTPTTTDGDKTIQVDKVSVTYYEFISKDNIMWEGYSKSIVFNEYKDLSAEKTWETVIYQFDGSTEEFDSAQYELNINDDKTSAGFYVITRTYYLNDDEKLIDDSPKYIVSTYDYFSRTLNTYVDRYNVVTQTETVAYTHDIYTLTVTKDMQDYTLEYHVYDNKYVCLPYETLDDSTGLPIILVRYDENTTDNARLKRGESWLFNPTTSWNRVTDENGKFYAMVEIEDYSSHILTTSHSSYTNEKTSSHTSSSTQSLIGGSMLVTMYSKYKYENESTQTVISIVHPGQTIDGILVLNSGDSFYTRQNTSNLAELSSIFDTNKLPLSIAIPKYKYVQGYENDAKSSEGTTMTTNTTYHYAYETNNLSYYFEKHSITSYELEVEVYYFENGINGNESPTEVFKSDGVCTTKHNSTDSTGYLRLREYNTSTGAFGDVVNDFTKPGTYYVKVTQEANEVVSSAYNFKNSYSFSFKIEDNKPDFNLRSETPLKSIMDTDFYGRENESLKEEVESYYTNKDEVQVYWKDSTSIYKANIDKTKIKLNINGVEEIPISIDNGIASFNGSKYEYNEDTHENTLTFSLRDLGITNNGQFFTITMQFVGHDADYYDTTTKKVIYDKCAPNEQVSSLFEKLSNAKYSLTLSDLREYYLADGLEKTDDPNSASYNQTISSGIYEKYAFTVSKDFFYELKDFLKQNIDNSNSRASTTFAYITKISSYPEGYHPSSNSYDFVETADTTRVLDNLVFDDIIKEGNYYEIVEKDLAGNITIYAVYAANSSGQYSDEFGADITQGIHYSSRSTNNVVNYVVNDKEIQSEKYEISSNTSFALEDIDFLCDQWNYFYTMTYNSNLGAYQTTYYVDSPNLEKGYVYKISTSQNKKSYTKVALSSLFENQEQSYKNKIYILDKLTGTYKLVNLSISDTAVLSLDITGTANSATMSIALPFSTLNSENYVSAKPVLITIKQNDSEIYSRQNNPNAFVNKLDYSYIDEFMPKTENVSVSYDNSYLRFTVSELESDTRITFSVTDNFGNPKSEVYLVGETKIDEILSNGNLYSYNTMIDDVYSTVHISSDDIIFSYNTNKYNPKIYYGSNTAIVITDYEISDNQEFYIQKYESGSIVSYTFASTKYQFDALIKIELNDKESGDWIKNVYIRLYNKLPYKTKKNNTDYYITLTNSNGIDDTDILIRKKSPIEDEEFITVDGKTYKVYSSTQTFSDEIKVNYRDSSDLDFPYEVKYISFEEFWTNGTSFVPLDSGAKLVNNGVYYILISYTSRSVLTKEYYLFKLEVLGSTGDQYYIIADGIKREKSKYYYKNPIDSKEYSSYYIVNISYEDSSLPEKFQIVTNNYQQIEAYKWGDGSGSANCYTCQYLITNYKNVIPGNSKGTTEGLEDGIVPYQQFIFVTFLEPKNNFLDILDGTTSSLYYITNDTTQTFVTGSTKQVKVVYDNTISTDSMSIYWKKYYGIESNEIDLVLEKDGRRVSVEKKSTGEFFYTTLTRSGSYTLRFIDTALNVQAFNSGMTSLPLIFIKDVHFTVSYKDPSTEEEIETEMINKAVYNSTVTLKINKLLVPYYLTSRFGSGDIITVYRNGNEYKDYQYVSQDYAFVFSELGYYEVFMTAYDQSAIGEKQIRTQKYSFSIISAKESRYAYNFSGYQSYYIKSVSKNGVDVTEALVKTLRNSSNTITVSGKEYLKNILISYYDQKTGSGRYQVTICANDMLYLNNNQQMACFTFEFFINSKPVPIVVSVAEGGTTNKNVSVQFNAKNVYESVGECNIIVGEETYHIDETTVDTVSLILGDDEYRGTHYIQVRTMSGNLLYSYKVNLTEPMNAWSIIAIIAGVGVAIAVIFIIIKLRKRMGVK